MSARWTVVSTIALWQLKAMEPTSLCNYRINKKKKRTEIFQIFYFFHRKSKCNADEELNRVFKILSSQENDVVRPRTITHLGRDLKFDKTCGQVLFSTFEDLCDRVRNNHFNFNLFHIFILALCTIENYRLFAHRILCNRCVMWCDVMRWNWFDSTKPLQFHEEFICLCHHLLLSFLFTFYFISGFIPYANGNYNACLCNIYKTKCHTKYCPCSKFIHKTEKSHTNPWWKWQHLFLWKQ